MIKIDQCSINNYIIITSSIKQYTSISKLCIVHTVYRLTALIQNWCSVTDSCLKPSNQISDSVLLYSIHHLHYVYNRLWCDGCPLLNGLRGDVRVFWDGTVREKAWPDLYRGFVKDILGLSDMHWQANPHTQRLAGKVNTLRTEVK